MAKDPHDPGQSQHAARHCGQRPLGVLEDLKERQARTDEFHEAWRNRLDESRRLGIDEQQRRRVGCFEGALECAFGAEHVEIAHTSSGPGRREQPVRVLHISTCRPTGKGFEADDCGGGQVHDRLEQRLDQALADDL